MSLIKKMQSDIENLDREIGAAQFKNAMIQVLIEYNYPHKSQFICDVQDKYEQIKNQ